MMNATIAFNSETLQNENLKYRHTGGISQNNRSRGFSPAFRDSHTGRVYLSRFSNGQLAPIHMIEGLPNDVVIARNETGCISAVKDSLISGFERDGNFYTRGEAASLCS